jgi:putative redox protein
MGKLGAGADRKVPRRLTQPNEPEGSHRATPYARNTGGRPVAIVQATWVGDHRFESGRPNGPQTLLDGDGKAAQSPVDALLSALAGCAGYDVVDILAKRRTPIRSMEVEVIGERAPTTPRRFLHIALIFRIAGEGIERAHAERAIDLSLNSYCSVRASLDPAIPIVWSLELEGEVADTAASR